MAYFANGTEGDYLDAQCCECVLPDDAPCPILFMQMTYNYKQFDNHGEKTEMSDVMNCLVNEKGICQMKLLLDKLKVLT